MSAARRYDVAVIGLGAMGSAVLAECVRRGMRSIGFEQFERGHELGSSAGGSRMIRKAYYEDPAYVPLVLRAYDAWRELERRSGVELLHLTGLLMIGDDQSAVLAGSRASAAAHELAIEELNAAQARIKFPMFAIRGDERVLYESDGGYIVPEAAIAAQLQLAQNAGAAMEFGVAADVEFALQQASRIVLCTGAWMHEAGFPLQVQRNVQLWFTPSDERFAEDRCPAFLVDRTCFGVPLYGFPDCGFGVKAALHGSGRFTPASEVERTVGDDDIAPVRSALDAALPGAAGAYRSGKVCMYELTPDRHFVISTHPSDDRVIVAGGFSGHGFKFAPVVAEIVADIAEERSSRFDIRLFSAARFS